MVLLEDGVIAVLAAVGLASLVWLGYGLLQPRCGVFLNTAALVLASGSAEELEQSVRALVHIRTQERVFSRIVILDRGLDDEAKVRAEILCRRYRGVELQKTIDTEGRSLWNSAQH